MSHYTVGYHDLQQNKYEICEYAEDVYQAIQNTKEDVPYLQEHPHFVDYCVSEEVKKVADFMAAGIPMGH